MALLVGWTRAAVTTDTEVVRLLSHSNDILCILLRHIDRNALIEIRTFVLDENEPV